MTGPLGRPGRALLTITVLVLGLLLALLYLELGYFQIPIVLVGAGLALMLTRPQWRVVRPPVAGAAAAVVAYAAVTTLAWITLLGQSRHQAFPMRWESRGSTNAHGATEVVLQFVGYPGHWIGEYSDDLYTYLAGQPDNPVQVTFEVSSDLFKCVRGFHATQIGTLDSWRAVWSYSGSDGTGPSPWDNPWWCP